MARYILIDNHSGYIFADTADLDGPARQETALEAVRRFDESQAVSNRDYVEHGPNYRPASNASAYYVYRADIGGSEAVPVVVDGQDRDTIDAVERSCRCIAVIEVAEEAVS
jgi:hypothetical protein